jgi:hypothetical protein
MPLFDAGGAWVDDHQVGHVGVAAPTRDAPGQSLRQHAAVWEIELTAQLHVQDRNGEFMRVTSWCQDQVAPRVDLDVCDAELQTGQVEIVSGVP